MQIDETLSNVISYDGEQLLEVKKIDDLSFTKFSLNISGVSTMYLDNRGFEPTLFLVLYQFEGNYEMFPKLFIHTYDYPYFNNTKPPIIIHNVT